MSDATTATTARSPARAVTHAAASVASTSRRPRVLIFASYYLPGYKAGGPIKAISNAIGPLRAEYEMIIVTRDRDVGAHEPYPRCAVGPPRHEGVSIHYLAPGPMRIVRIRQLMRSYRPDLIYLNSVFDPVFTAIPLLLRKLRLVHRSAGIVLAPRGEFAPGALALKSRRKRLFLRLAKRLRLYAGTVWQATSNKEVTEIHAVLHTTGSDVVVVPDSPSAPQPGQQDLCPDKPPGPLRVVFLARIARMKNLEGALRILMEVREPVEFSIWGPIEDQQYWSFCQALIGAVPSNVAVRYLGAVTPDRVPGLFLGQDLLLLPTLGESFGHVICEAWASWCPVLISDRTPWRDLERKGVGWDLPLGNRQAFADVIDRCARMDAHQYRILKRCSRSYAEELSAGAPASTSLRPLFAQALGHRPLLSRASQ